LNAALGPEPNVKKSKEERSVMNKSRHMTLSEKNAYAAPSSREKKTKKIPQCYDLHSKEKCTGVTLRLEQGGVGALATPRPPIKNGTLPIKVPKNKRIASRSARKWTFKRKEQEGINCGSRGKGKRELQRRRRGTARFPLRKGKENRRKA